MEQTIYDAGVGVIIEERRDIQSYDEIFLYGMKVLKMDLLPMSLNHNLHGGTD